MNDAATTDPGPCVRCGALTRTRLGGVFICQPCYEVRSSCCPEFGPDDLASVALGPVPEEPADLAGGKAEGPPRRSGTGQRT